MGNLFLHPRARRHREAAHLRSVPTLILILLVATVAPVGEGQVTGLDPRGIALNLKVGESHGCSPDAWTSPDLAARVWRGDTLLGETFKAQDKGRAEWFALFEFPDESPSGTLAIEVREAEPGGFLFTGTSWLECDVDPGPGNWLNVTVAPGGAAFSSTGDGSDAASVSGYAAAMTATHPRTASLTLANATTESLRVAWTSPDAASERAELVWGSGTLAPGSHEATFTGLQDASSYWVRVVRESGPWTVAAAPKEFRTLNAPPPGPTVDVRPGVRSAHVVLAASAHDLAEMEVHVSDAAGFAPNASTLRGRDGFARFGSSQFDVGDLDASKTWYARGVTVDEGGLRTVSAPVAFRPLPAPTPLNQTRPTVTTDRSGVRLDWSTADLAGFQAFDVVVGDETVGTSTTANVTLTTLQPGVKHALRVRGVRADATTLSSLPVDLTWDRPNLPPVVSFSVSPDVRLGGETVARVRAEDPDGDALRLVLDWGDGNTTTPGAADARHAYAQPGEYVVTLTTTEAFAPPSVAKRNVTIRANHAPTGELRIPRSVLLADAVNANVTWSDADGDAVSVAFDWGDGRWTDARSHPYVETGAHVVKARLDDGHGGVVLLDETVDVLPFPRSATEDEPANQTPLVDVTEAATREGETLVAAAAEDPHAPAPTRQPLETPGLGLVAMLGAVVALARLRTLRP